MSGGPGVRWYFFVERLLRGSEQLRLEHVVSIIRKELPVGVLESARTLYLAYGNREKRDMDKIMPKLRRALSLHDRVVVITHRDVPNYPELGEMNMTITK